MINLSDEDYVIKDGERICQIITARHERAVWKEVNVLEETGRRNGGFGHTRKE